jgi:hypothetical protein
MKRSQQMTHGVQAAAHAVRGGDSHGGGASIDLSESVGVVLFEAGRRRAEMFDLVEDALDEVRSRRSRLERHGFSLRLRFGGMLGAAPWS